MSDGWVGCDLDGTLAHYEGGPLLPIGKPVPLMVERVRMCLKLGLEVRVFTARVSDPDRRTQAKVVEAIEAWCEEHLGQKLKITNIKDFSCIEIWDDRAVQVEPNTGRLIGSSRIDAGLREAYNRMLHAASSSQSAGPES